MLCYATVEAVSRRFGRFGWFLSNHLKKRGNGVGTAFPFRDENKQHREGGSSCPLRSFFTSRRNLTRQTVSSSSFQLCNLSILHLPHLSTLSTFNPFFFSSFLPPSSSTSCMTTSLWSSRQFTFSSNSSSSSRPWNTYCTSPRIYSPTLVFDLKHILSATHTQFNAFSSS